MRNGEIGDNLPRHELHALQRALRVRASNLKKRGKGLGLIRPLSKDDIGQCPHRSRMQTLFEFNMLLLLQSLTRLVLSNL